MDGAIRRLCEPKKYNGISYLWVTHRADWMNNNYSNTHKVVQGANCWGRTLVVLFSTTSAVSGSQGLTDSSNKGHPFYTKITCALHHLEWSDDIMMMS